MGSKDAFSAQEQYRFSWFRNFVNKNGSLSKNRYFLYVYCAVLLKTPFNSNSGSDFRTHFQLVGIDFLPGVGTGNWN